MYGAIRQGLVDLAVLALVMGCSGSKGPIAVAGVDSQSPKAGTTTGLPAEVGSASREAVGARGRGLTLDGEHFTPRTIIDRQQGGMPVAVFLAPQTWPDHSEVTWNYSQMSNPVQASARAENPANDEAYFLYPNLDLFWLLPAGYFRPGQNYLGQIYAQPTRPEIALATFAQQARGRFPGFKIVGSKSLPGLPAALGVPSSKTQQGVGIKVTYERDGRPLEEEFYAVYYRVNVPYDGPQGRTWQTNWGMQMVHSFRAAAGTLERRREVFAAIARSLRRNPAWQARLAAINQYLSEQFNRQLQAGYDQIAAAGRLSQQISANNDAMLASIDSRLQASRSSGAQGSGRSGPDKFDDYVRGVDTMDDPYYGTSQRPSTQTYHWTDGYGGYRDTNDAGADPNQHESGSWTLMQPSR